MVKLVENLQIKKLNAFLICNCQHHIQCKMTHNVGRVPWALLDDAIQFEKIEGTNDYEMVTNEYTIIHFDRKFMAVLDDYSKTNKREFDDLYNPKTWRSLIHSPACMSYDFSIIGIYIFMNLFVINPNKYKFVLDWRTETFRGDFCDTSHPEYFTDMYNEIKDELKKTNNKLTTEIFMLIREYVKELYNCVIVMKTNKNLHENVDYVLDTIRDVDHLKYDSDFNVIRGSCRWRV